MMTGVNILTKEIRRLEIVKIKRCKTDLISVIIFNYFSELAKSAADVSVENVINYDETSITDDSGKQKIFTRKESKHVR